MNTGRRFRDAEQLTAEKVSVQFGGVSALEEVSLAIKRQEVLGLIGPNGAGKTTLINVLTGFLRCSSGRLLLQPGQEITRWVPERVACAGVARTFQNVRIFKEFSVTENVLAGAIGNGGNLKAATLRASRILEWLGLEMSGDVIADTLAYGDERMVGIGRALAMEPSFLLLDEPAAGLNDSECECLMHTISRIPGEFGCGVLLVEHNMKVVMGVSHRVHVIDFGRTIAEGEPADIKANPEVIRAYLGDST